MMSAFDVYRRKKCNACARYGRVLDFYFENARTRISFSKNKLIRAQLFSCKIDQKKKASICKHIYAYCF